MPNIPNDARALEANRQALADIAVESWRLDRVVERAIYRMDPQDAERFISQYRWYQKKVDDALALADMRIVDLTGLPYDIGMAVTPLNADEYADDDLIVSQMVEPIIMHQGRVLKPGKVMLSPPA